MIATTNPHDPIKIGIVSISDRVSTGVYEDKGLPYQLISYKIKFVLH